MQLSKTEYKYRYKIIYENHLKKDVQRYIDSYVVENNTVTYKHLYSNPNLLHSILTKYNLDKIGYAIKNVGTTCKRVAKAFENLSSVFSSTGIELEV